MGIGGRAVRLTALAAATLLTVAVALVLPPSSPAKHGGAKTKHRALARVLPPGFSLGVMPPQYPSAEELSRMRAAGITIQRLVFSPRYAERQPGVINWSTFDDVIADAARQGITVLPLLLEVPRWMSPNPASLPIDSPAQREGWAGFVSASAARYGPGGSFWSAHPELPARPLVDWEVWNEPNINGFVGGTASAWRYAQLLRQTRDALRAGNPATRAWVAGLFRRPKPGLGQRMIPFLKRLYRVPGFRRSFDGLAIHPYATRPIQALRVTAKVRRLMRAHRNARKPIWITELGWATGGSDWATSRYRATFDRQARRLARSFGLLAAHRTALGLRGVIWFSWRDYVIDGRWPNFMGLFTATGQPKPAWDALLRFTRGQGLGPLSDLGRKPAPPPPPPRPPGSPPPPRPCFLIFC
jgi:hypothetical protein